MRLSAETKKKVLPFCVVGLSIAMLVGGIVIKRAVNTDEDSNSSNGKFETKTVEVDISCLEGNFSLGDIQQEYNNARTSYKDLTSYDILTRLVPQVNVCSEEVEVNEAELKSISSKFPEFSIPDYTSGNYTVNQSGDIPFVSNINSLADIKAMIDKDAVPRRFYLHNLNVDDFIAPNLVKYSFDNGSSVVYIYFVTDMEWDYITSGSKFTKGTSYEGDITLSSSMFNIEQDGDTCYMYAYFVGGLNESLYG